MSFDEAHEEEKKERTLVLAEETWLHARQVGHAVNGKALLKGIDAEFAPKTMTAILSPSAAAGKTLLKTLSGRAPGETRGEVFASGRRLRKSKTSYVPEDDVHYERLTVKQMLSYSALLRCPKAWTHDDKMDKVDEIIQLLGLGRVAEERLGQIDLADRKRASAAVEFLSTHSLLFMDRPMHGLGENAAALAFHLSTGAKVERRTILATVDAAESSWQLLTSFDKLLVLSDDLPDGATVVFQGPPAQLPDYLQRGGTTLPLHENPAEFFVHRLKEGGGVAGGPTPDEWIDIWHASDLKLSQQQVAEHNLNKLLNEPEPPPPADGSPSSPPPRDTASLEITGGQDSDDDDDDGDEVSALAVSSTWPPICGTPDDAKMKKKQQQQRVRSAKDIVKNLQTLV
mmetsp:Transcript_34220/g.109904  ORF Transcript_34220/g.109904 Transcript_34220/m.109904 type:complete len:399 (-) Transcript_34220:269-1465(-)